MKWVILCNDGSRLKKCMEEGFLLRVYTTLWGVEKWKSERFSKRNLSCRQCQYLKELKT